MDPLLVEMLKSLCVGLDWGRKGLNRCQQPEQEGRELKISSWAGTTKELATDLVIKVTEAKLYKEKKKLTPQNKKNFNTKTTREKQKALHK